MSDSERGGRANMSAQTKTLRQMLFLAVIVLVVTSVTRFISNSSANSNMTFDDVGFQIEISDRTVCSGSYSDIQQISLAEMPDDLGTCLSGEERRNLYSGVWENETWGSYVAYLKPSLSQVIVMETTEQTIVINLESDASTESLYVAILDMIEAES